MIGLGLAVGGILAVVIGIGGFSIHSLRGQVATLKTEKASMAASIKLQNESIDALAEQGRLRAAAAQKALEAARAAAKAGEIRAQRLLATQLKSGEDPCTAADALISNWLRGGK